MSRSLKFKVNFFTRARSQAKVIFNYLSFILSPFFPGIRLCAKPLCRNKVVASNSKFRGRAITALTKALPALYKRGYSPQLSREVKIWIVTRAPFALCKSGYSSQYNKGIEEFIPWKLTSSGINALTSINKFYIWIPNENPIKSFIDTHCLNLLKSEPFLGQKDTGILTSFYTVESMLSNSALLDCKYLRSPEKAFDDISSSYIYSFINKKDHRFYIGSTINSTSRLHNYIHSWTIARQGLLQEMSCVRRSGGGFDNYYFFPGLKVPNYLNLFTKYYPECKLDVKSMFILNCFSEYHVRLLEQSIISHLKPEINDINTSVSYTFGSINIETYNPKIWSNSHFISVYDKEGKLYNKYSSINKAKIALGLTEFEIHWLRSRNRENHFLLCPNPNLELRIVDETLKSISTSAPLSSFQKLIPITGINLDEIPYGLIYVYLDDKETLYEIFNSSSEFASAHNINPWQAYRYINLVRRRAIPIKKGVLSVFLCSNPTYRKNIIDSQDKKNWPVVSIDTLNNNLIRYHENPNAARLELSALEGVTDIKLSRNFTQDYITGPKRKGEKTKPSKFRKRFKLLWLKDYTFSDPDSDN